MVGHERRRVEHAGVHHRQHAVDVSDHVRVAGLEGQGLDPDDSHVHLDAFGVNADGGDRARLAGDARGEIEGVRVSDGVDGGVDSAPAGGGLDGGARIVLGEVLGLGPVGLCAVQAAKASGAAKVIAIDSVPERLELAASFGAEPVHLTEDDPRAAVKAATDGRGVDAAIDAVGHRDALDLACRVTRKAGTVSATGVYAERIELHMGIVWIKALTLRTGQANVIGQVDRVLAMLAGGVIDPSPLVTHHMKLEDAAEAYAIYDRREALKIVMTP